ncbi:MAG: DegV family protein [Candidatus Heimdallarchaeota archaeon]|nr:MAG: DegV family protein [Candidatus Heimdallarchaeota archaeon]
MSKITIVTAGLSELTKDLIEQYNVVTVPYRIIFGDEAFYIKNNNEVELTTEEFCEKLKTVTKDNFPRTSVPSPGDYSKAIDEAFEKSDSVIAITLTSGMSGAYQAANGVVESLYKDKDITVFDSLHTMTGVGIQALEAAKMAQNGESKEEILKKLETIRPKTRNIFAMKDLDFLEKQGRLGPIEQIRDKNPEVIPVIQTAEGILKPLTIFNNAQDLIDRMSAFAKKICEVNETDDIFLSHINNKKAADVIYKVLMDNKKESTTIHYSEACAILGAYTGPNTVSLSYVGAFESEWLN